MPITNNIDVAGIARRVNRFIDELQKAASGAGSQVTDADFSRATSYLNAVRAYHDHVISQPQLDLPETHPREIQVEEGPPHLTLENESLTDLTYMLALARDEMVNGQSSRQGSGLNKFDSARLVALLDKCDLFMNGYVSNVTPLDLPESSPMRAGSAPGRGGI